MRVGQDETGELSRDQITKRLDTKLRISLSLLRTMGRHLRFFKHHGNMIDAVIVTEHMCRIEWREEKAG